MTELDILMHAKDYIDKLAQGIDPISGQEMPEDTVLNQARLVRCFFYVSGVLQQVIDNGGVAAPQPAKKRGRAYFHLTDEMRNQVVYSSEPIMIRRFLQQLNEMIDPETTRQLSATTVTGWLVEKVFLYQENYQAGKSRKLPTQAGLDLGISQENRVGDYGEYVAILYNEQAQHFIIDHMEDILDWHERK